MFFLLSLGLLVKDLRAALMGLFALFGLEEALFTPMSLVLADHLFEVTGATLLGD
jgi:hypothetical protein